VLPGNRIRSRCTGKERDSETGLDYFGARYYSNGLGRFITPDWAAKAAAVPYADFADPQSLNLYTYVRNIPTSKADADGHDTLGDIMYAGITITGQYIGHAVVDTVSSVGHWLTSGPPPHPLVPGPSATRACALHSQRRITIIIRTRTILRVVTPRSKGATPKASLLLSSLVNRSLARPQRNRV
jgi:RHS repeat-associated protein